MIARWSRSGTYTYGNSDDAPYSIQIYVLKYRVIDRKKTPPHDDLNNR